MIVMVPVRDRDPLSVTCLRSLRAYSRAEVPVLVCDSSSARAPELDEKGELLYVNADLAAAVPMTGRADLVVVHPQCVVSPGWLDGLRDIAHSDGRIASVTALTLHRGELDGAVHGLAVQGLSEATFEDAAAALRARARALHPRAPGPSGCCIYLSRRALDLAGAPDPGFFPGAGPEPAFATRCLDKGLAHVLADDVAVAYLPARPLTAAPRDPLDEDRAGPLGQALSRARRSLTGLEAVIDGRVLSGPVNGTHVQVLGVISALARTEQVRLGVLVPAEPNEHARSVLDAHPNVATFAPHEAARLRARPVDVVHRPYQVNNPGDVPLLSAIGQRLIVTHQDLISYHNPAYFADVREWEGYRTLTRVALSVADRVIFLSEQVRDDVLSEELVDPARVAVIRNGVDHGLANPEAPTGLPTHDQMLVCLGTDYQHKNRVFALQLMQQLQRRHGWDGHLVLAGGGVKHGSSKADEAVLLAGDQRLADRVVDLGPVSEAEKAWLLRHAALVLYPTISEGFGLIPFEAARAGVACMWAPGTALDEVLPANRATIVPWDAAASAAHALELLTHEAARRRVVEAVMAAGAELTWGRTAARLLEQYEAACDGAPSPAGGLERRESRGGVSEDGMRLVGPAGALPTEVERPLLALATNPTVGRPVFRLLTAAYRVGHRWRQRRR